MTYAQYLIRLRRVLRSTEERDGPDFTDGLHQVLSHLETSHRTTYDTARSAVTLERLTLRPGTPDEKRALRAVSKAFWLVATYSEAITWTWERGHQIDFSRSRNLREQFRLAVVALVRCESQLGLHAPRYAEVDNTPLFLCCGCECYLHADSIYHAADAADGSGWVSGDVYCLGCATGLARPDEYTTSARFVLRLDRHGVVEQVVASFAAPLHEVVV